MPKIPQLLTYFLTSFCPNHKLISITFQLILITSLSATQVLASLMILIYQQEIKFVGVQVSKESYLFFINKVPNSFKIKLPTLDCMVGNLLFLDL